MGPVASSYLCVCVMCWAVSLRSVITLLLNGTILYDSHPVGRMLFV